MRYCDINQLRLNNILDTLKKSHEMITKQNRLGLENSRCCNHLIDADGKDFGCIVGCLVGPTNFSVGNSMTAMDLDDSKLALAYKNATNGCNWSYLSLEDKTCYQRFLSGLQSLHDTSESFGFKGTELVLFILRVLINRIEDIVNRVDNFPSKEVQYLDFNLTLGNHNYKNFDTIFRDITAEIDKFIVKK